MAKTNPDDFLLNTDYEMDKIVLVKEGNFTSTTQIPHNLNFTPLPFGVWSLDADFSSVNPIGQLDFSTEPGYTPILSVECSADDTNLTLNSAGNTNSQTIYYRLYAFQPNDENENVPATATKAKQFILNTDYNYCKLMKAGTFDGPNEEFEHKLGYIPQVMAWIRYTSPTTYIQPLMGFSEYTNFGLTVTDQKIIFNDVLMPGLIDKVYWRIYYDNA